MAAWLWAIPRDRYPAFIRTDTFALKRTGQRQFARIQSGDQIFAYVSGTKALAGIYEAQGAPFEDTTPLVTGQHLPHRLRVRPLLRLPRENWVPLAAFADTLDLAREYGTLQRVLQQGIHPLPAVDAKVLEFLVRAREAASLDTILALAEAIRAEQADTPTTPHTAEPEATYTTPAHTFSWPEAMEALLAHLAAQGLIYAPWQVAAYVAALRTKPFVILAGVTGTGKTQLPLRIAEATGSKAHLIPVRPDWTDSADVLGFSDLQGRFRPGALLLAAHAAQQDPSCQHMVVLDEMNQAKAAHYLAEVLSVLEQRPTTLPLLTEGLRRMSGAPWDAVHIPSNAALVGTVNMDESGHNFSHKVLDRAFTLELSDVDFSTPVPHEAVGSISPWRATAWQPTPVHDTALLRVNTELTAANRYLRPANLHLAYRSRDEIAGFLTHATAFPDAFRTRTGAAVDPMDLAMMMKLLPRLLGSRMRLQQVILGLLGWASVGTGFSDERTARPWLDTWQRTNDPDALETARFPRTAARLTRMWHDLQYDGFTSFWGS